jgi:two-component system, OmpR family, copper resistance phosphate regulon response regulator CusR
MAMRVLVVEDDRKVAEALREGLQTEDYDVAVERTGEGAFFRTSTEAFDLVLLDLGLPGRDGLEVMAAIRRKQISVPIIVLTARDTVAERVVGLDAGADDYMVKPFAFAELLARMRVLLRRGRPPDARQMTVGSLSLDAISRKVTRSGQPLDLTLREFELLEFLMRYEGQVVSRDTLAREVWKEPGRTPSLDNVIDAHMARLRRKFEDGDIAARMIHTIRGVGFMLREGEP